MYNTIESNKEKIAINEELIKNRNKRKKDFFNYNKYRAGLQTDLYERLQDISSIKKQLSETETKLSETKEVVPFVEEEPDEEEQRQIYYKQLMDAYKELDVFNPTPISKVSPTSKFIVHIDPHTKKVDMYMNENKKMAITKFNPLDKTFEMNGKTFEFNKNIINLMRGDYLTNHEEEDLKQYALILKEAGAHKSSGRYKDVTNKIGRVGSGLITFLPDNPSELFDRLHILIAARKEGHNSSENEIHAILKRLLEKNLITSEQYKFFS